MIVNGFALFNMSANINTYFYNQYLPNVDHYSGLNHIKLKMEIIESKIELPKGLINHCDINQLYNAVLCSNL